MKHLEEAGLTYFQHMRRAFGFSFICLRASIKALIHGLLPWYYQDASKEVEAWFK